MIDFGNFIKLRQNERLSHWLETLACADCEME